MNSITPLSGEAQQLYETVISGGYCIGCGACTFFESSPFLTQLDEYGRLQATLKNTFPPESFSQSFESVCPFSAKAENEDTLGKEYLSDGQTYDRKIGYYLSVYAGFAQEGPYRASGSSGGMTTWLLANLLNQGWVDSVIHVSPKTPTASDPRLFQYQISTTPGEIVSGAKSRYYPVDMSEVLRVVRDRPGRYVIVGIPCFIKAVRLLMRQDAALKVRIVFCVGLICGHLKSTHFTKMIAWQSGLDPERLTAIDFRKKIRGSDANHYATEVRGIMSGKEKTICLASKNIYGSDWGAGFFKYKACDFCDDVFAETADITIGDAWLPRYLKDWRGTNLLVVRHPRLKNLLELGASRGLIHIETLEAQAAAQSQDAGLRHRRDGLAYRLYLADEKHEWRPPKRVQPDADHLDNRRKKQQSLRMELSSKSHGAFKKALENGTFSFFTSQMDPLLDRYYSLYHSAGRNFARRLKRLLQKMISH